MWDLIASVPDHCLSFYFTSSILIRRMDTFYFAKYILNVSTLETKINHKCMNTTILYMFLLFHVTIKPLEDLRNINVPCWLNTKISGFCIITYVQGKISGLPIGPKNTRVSTNMPKQVAQRATIAHLSPMCQHPFISNKPASKVIKNLNSFQIREQLFFVFFFRA